VRFAAEIRADQLDRDDPIDEHVTGSINDTHPALADASLQAVTTRDDFAQCRIIAPPASGSAATLLRNRLCHVVRNSALNSASA
jgi:hypothetical protein